MSPPPPEGPTPPGPALPSCQPPPPAPPPARPAAYGYPPPQRYVEPPPSKSTAGWALGLSILPCLAGISTLVGIALAITVLVRSRDGRDHGKGLAVAALIIAGSWILVGLVAGVSAVVDERDRPREELRTSPIGERAVQLVHVGDCLNAPALTDAAPDTPVETETVRSMPCAAPHEYEAFRTFTLDGEDYPGEDGVVTRADEGCLAAFRDFVGVPPRRSGLAISYLYPSEETWRFRRDRVVTCLISDPQADVTGSLAGAKR